MVNSWAYSVSLVSVLMYQPSAVGIPGDAFDRVVPSFALGSVSRPNTGCGGIHFSPLWLPVGRYTPWYAGELCVLCCSAPDTICTIQTQKNWSVFSCASNRRSIQATPVFFGALFNFLIFSGCDMFRHFSEAYVYRDRQISVAATVTNVGLN